MVLSPGGSGNSKKGPPVEEFAQAKARAGAKAGAIGQEVAVTGVALRGAASNGRRLIRIDGEYMRKTCNGFAGMG